MLATPNAQVLTYDSPLDIADCGIPMAPIDGFLGNYTHTREGAVVTYGCNDGFVPSATNTATCMESGEWYPPPNEHNCTMVTGMCLVNE